MCEDIWLEFAACTKCIKCADRTRQIVDFRIRIPEIEQNKKQKADSNIKLKYLKT